MSQHINQQGLPVRTGRPVVNIDVPAVVGQFLNDISLSDLVVELIQNELDAGSTRTRIHFSTDALICEGNGIQVDPKGWQRLRYILGAGGDVEAKKGGIGAKNHGLRAAFLLGDTITVQSAGQRIDLTVRGDDSDATRFYPAVWPEEADSLAPRGGTRITVQYRRTPLTVPSGERFDLRPITDEIVQSLYTAAVEEAPARFIAASAPGKRWAYEISFSLREEPNKLLRFSCEPLKHRYADFCRRSCRTLTLGKRPQLLLKQLGTPFEITLPDEDQGKVPSVFRRGRRIYGELSWNSGVKDIPTPGTGALRYPIGYPIEHQRSGYGFDISAPFISSRARHTVSEDARNSGILKTARTAFAALLRRRLIPLYGAPALRVISSVRFVDPEAEDLLVAEMLDAGALPIARTERARKRTSLKTTISAPKGSKWMPTVASPIYDRESISPDLVLLTSPEEDTVHPDTPRSVVAALMRFADRLPNPRVKWFNEEHAAIAALLGNSSLDKQPATPEWIDRCETALKMLNESAHRSTLSDSLVKKLKASGFLPTDFGQLAAWARVRRTVNAVPAIPGIVPPPILVRRLNKLSLLKEGRLRIEKFNVNDFVARADFSHADASQRQRFFEWLRKAHANLKPKTLAAIASYPIWPDQIGNHHDLAYYCWPSSSALRALILEVRPAPADSVTSFPGLRRSVNGALILRTKPTPEELREWYKKRIEQALTIFDEANSKAAQNALYAIDEQLEKLRQGGHNVAVIADGHKAMSGADTLRDVADLHIYTGEVEECALLSEDLVANQFSALYTVLGAKTRPMPAAVLKALRAKPDEGRLFSRLDAFKRSGGSLEELAGEAIIQIKDRLFSPGELTFPGTIDYWGKWKTPLEKTPPIPDCVQLLQETGIVRQALREDLSRGFFSWLSVQNPSIQLSHLPQVIRHWRERSHGPSKWWSHVPTLSCLPVRNHSNDLELVSHSRATRIHSKVFLPDFPDVQEKLLLDITSCRLVITEARGISGSILDVVREAGVKSLRMQAGRPLRIVAAGDIDLDQALDQALQNARSPKMLKELNQRLPQYEVPASALRSEWRKHLLELKGVRLTARPNAVFSILQKEYNVAVQSGVDEQTRLICIDSRVDRKLAFYEALASYIFFETSSRLWAYGLLRAVENPFAPMLLDPGPVRLDDEDLDGEPIVENENSNPSSAEPPNKGHGIAIAKLTPTAPDPGRLSDISDRATLSGKKVNYPRGGRARTSTEDPRHTIEEEEQKLQLKEKHYAWHCQACLGEYEVLEATPPGSYIYLPSFRQNIIHAHHVTHLQNEGDIGAKNLLILCKFHHDYIGDKLSNAAVKSALAIAPKALRRFPTNQDGTETVDREGLVAEVQLDTNPFRMRLYFTAQHAEAWSG